MDLVSCLGQGSGWVGIQIGFKDAQEDAAGWGGGPLASVPQSLVVVDLSS